MFPPRFCWHARLRPSFRVAASEAAAAPTRREHIIRLCNNYTLVFSPTAVGRGGSMSRFPDKMWLLIVDAPAFDWLDYTLLGKESRPDG